MSGAVEFHPVHRSNGWIAQELVVSAERSRRRHFNLQNVAVGAVGCAVWLDLVKADVTIEPGGVRG